jgi:hypothetical protein
MLEFVHILKYHYRQRSRIGGGFAMKAERYLNEEAAIKKGVDALVRELGPVEAMRFLNLPRESRQESVKRHREWQKTLDKKYFLMRCSDRADQT